MSCQCRASATAAVQLFALWPDHLQSRYLQVVRLFDTITGKPLGEPIKHSMEMYAISLNHFGSLADRKLLIIDRNRDLYIVAVGLHIAGKAVPPYKLGALT
jgi:intraflagellar transport protein 80